MTKIQSNCVTLMVLGALFLSTGSDSRAAAPKTNSSSTSSPSTASKVGSAVGSALDAALSAAFPGLDPILNAIWPKGKENSNKKKPDATQATSDLKTKADQGQQQLADVSAQLDVVTKFLASCMDAEVKVIELRTFLKGKKSPLSSSDKLSAKDVWNKAQAGVVSLKDADALVTSLRNPAMQKIFRDVLQANNGTVSDITEEINSDAPNALDLANDNLATLDSQLAAVNGLSGEIIASVSAAIKSASQPSGRGEATLNFDSGSTRMFDIVLKNRYKNLNQ